MSFVCASCGASFRERHLFESREFRSWCTVCSTEYVRCSVNAFVLLHWPSGLFDDLDPTLSEVSSFGYRW